MTSFGPGNVIPELVIVGNVVPRPSLGLILGAGRTTEDDLRNAVIVVGSAKQSRYGKTSGLLIQSGGHDIEPVSVVVEGDLVD